MYLGIDVGGTHTDGVLLNQDFDIARSAKVRTRADDVMASLNEVLEAILDGADPAEARRLVVSSTLGLNAVLTGRADRVGVMCTGGPGLSPAWLDDGPLFALLEAGLDHRGEVIAPFSEEEAAGEAKSLIDNGARALAVISKFGPKNPQFEMEMARVAAGLAPGLPITQASALAGRLNFPRRLNTAVFNSAVIRLYEKFLNGLEASALKMGLSCPVSLLSSEGGAMSIEEARKSPVMILAAGPAAGILGLWSMADLEGDALMIDIGGTSTDLAVMADGRPLMTAEGLDIKGKPTLARAFLTSSIALGGDSAITFRDGQVRVGPEREGPALSLCPDEAPGRRPTLTDALNVLRLAEVGDAAISFRSFEALGGAGPEAIAGAALDCAMRLVEEAVRELIFRINNRPVYTINEVRLAREVRPQRAALLGGPAEALAVPLTEKLNLPVMVPPQSEVANAVGAACSRPSVTAELYADTSSGRLSIPSLGIYRTIDRSYNVKMAETELLGHLEALFSGPEAEKPVITHAQSFHQLSGYGRSDKIIRVQAQIAPGVMSCRKN
ncbi:hydantoinase [Deltaproteobacteria bacterium Smac51]|nr:hydantoinase [Deltaproteobacteria bacterium Smac51]